MFFFILKSCTNIHTFTRLQNKEKHIKHHHNKFTVIPSVLAWVRWFPNISLLHGAPQSCNSPSLQKPSTVPFFFAMNSSSCTWWTMKIPSMCTWIQIVSHQASHCSSLAFISHSQKSSLSVWAAFKRIAFTLIHPDYWPLSSINHRYPPSFTITLNKSVIHRTPVSPDAVSISTALYVS